MRAKLRDVVVVLPGICGSVLTKDGSPVWAPTWGVVGRNVLTRGRSLDVLKIDGDDPDVDDLGDGVRATGLVETAYVVPGLVKIDIYSGLLRMFTDTFDVVPGPGPTNFVPFPYDWRRDLRAVARQLDRVVATALTDWRAYTGDPAAKVVLVAHSMGGLVARYWLNVLGGAGSCRALITLGTPHRGSPQALDFLVNGYRKMLIDLTEVMRSFTSVHQLLPIYRCVADNGGWSRVADVGDRVGVDAVKARSALAFHREIESGTGAGDYAMIPVVGTAQPTIQSAELGQTELRASRSAPPIIGPALADGDGTVPRVSAIPLEVSELSREIVVAERHSALQNNEFVLTNLREKLLHLQHRGLGAIRGPGEVRTGPPGIALDVPDACLEGEPVVIQARFAGAGPCVVRAEPVDQPGRDAVVVELANAGDAWTGALTDLPAGLYRLTVGVRDQRPGAPRPVRDLVQVMPR